MHVVQLSLLLTKLFELFIAIMPNFGRSFFLPTTVSDIVVVISMTEI